MIEHSQNVIKKVKRKKTFKKNPGKDLKYRSFKINIL